LFEQLARALQAQDHSHRADAAALAAAAMAVGTLALAQSSDDAALMRRVVQACSDHAPTRVADDDAKPVFLWAVDGRDAHPPARMH
jgi:hypothetical protein